MDVYNREFYSTRHQKSIHSAEVVLGVVKDILPSMSSAVDLGCGVGTWLSVLEKQGVSEVCGVEGDWLSRDLLEIQEKDYVAHDFSKESRIKLDRRFDLAISLEVAEHLPNSASEGFVDSLTGLSDFVLFSAAIPYQGGRDHINEQWTEFWIGLFEARGYTALDVVRKRIWNDDTILSWYRQNTILYVKSERVNELNFGDPATDNMPPEKYLLSYKQATSPRVKQAFGGLLLALKRRLGLTS